MKASDDWWFGFKRSHHELSLRIARNISTSLAEAFNEDRVNKFYTDIKESFDREIYIVSHNWYTTMMKLAELPYRPTLRKLLPPK
jgi:hypothetical protein